jgi:hypothetical protein
MGKKRIGSGGGFEVWVDLFTPLMLLFPEPVLVLAVLRIERHITKWKEPDGLHNNLLAMHSCIQVPQDLICILDKNIRVDFLEGCCALSGMNDGSTWAGNDHVSFCGG